MPLPDEYGTESSRHPEASVSVVVPLYNGGPHIAQTLRAIAQQTHPNIEVIVVDDASTDDSLAQVERSGVALRLVRQANRGVSAARNAGLREARGDFICFLDQDDIWHPTHLQRQLDVMHEQPQTAVVVSPYQYWFPRGPVGPAPLHLFGEPQGLRLDADFSGWVYHQFLLDCWALTSATMMRRSAVTAAGGFDETLPFSEDWDLWLRLSRQVPFAHLRWPPVLYRQHPVQGSRKARPVDYRSRLLLEAAARYGLASRDGRRISRRRFDRTIADYEMEFGYHHLGHGSRTIALQALWRAWRREPRLWKALAYAGAALAGWRPRSGGFAEIADVPVAREARP